jgi:DNA end-binding protein Ku
VSFNQLNRNTGNRIRYKKVDGETGGRGRSRRHRQVEKDVYVQVEDEERGATDRPLAGV